MAIGSKEESMNGTDESHSGATEKEGMLFASFVDSGMEFDIGTIVMSSSKVQKNELSFAGELCTAKTGGDWSGDGRGVEKAIGKSSMK